VVIWLTERYPQSPPFIYVTPTETMVLRPDHNHVDPSGMVHTPCLDNWLFPSSNLLDTTTEMSIIFGSETPLYTKAAVPVAAPAYQQGPMYNPAGPAPAGGAGAYPYGNANMGGAEAAAAAARPGGGS
jgi:ESCRT-I complex subunit TSG101